MGGQDGSGRTMAWSWTSSIPPSPEAPSVARSFVESSLGSAYRDSHAVAETCDDLLVIVSELVTNAVQASSAALRVDLAIEGRSVRLAVTDVASGMPTMNGRADPTQPYGRGLAIVAALAHAWGIVPATETEDGKTVWAQLELVAPPDAGS